MLLKKQTVWLLTMLSLVVVLSVYYITSPEQKGNDITAVQQNAKDQLDSKQAQAAKKTVDKSGKTIVSQVSDDTFDALRLQLEDQRSQQKEDLQAQVASTDLPADKRSEAYDQMQKLSETAQKEEVLETLIKTLGYEDALVRADAGKVNITVKSKKKHSATAANDIIQLVKKEIDTNFVAVEFQPSK
ncbi:SpoIIIAH-like family protein [Neobacillus sp. PS3-40]|jgi:stage III sporulation protein AH|uniref:SpoIIIAH-like family protein n=1 Tax=Neobacillus sp. PS3-40 TaxID=3070679 RepID=UPI0027DFC83E|nr:SpoIIIAH-like family protein [Neobacillus sp. PS3-40]WML45250.1 SpoIIIAH-like family protein [Neobacillus sp. PS3-40]